MSCGWTCGRDEGEPFVAEMWYWQENEFKLNRHDASKVRQPGNWVAYDDEVQDKLSAVYRQYDMSDGRSSPCVIIECQGPDGVSRFEIDVVARKQKNVATGYARSVLMVPDARLFGSCDLNEVSAAAQLQRDEPTTKMMWFWEENMHRLNKHDSRLVPSFWVNGETIPDSWVQYPIHVQTALTATYRRCKRKPDAPTVYVSRDMTIMHADESYDYAIDVIKRKQTNRRTGHVRAIHLLMAQRLDDTYST